MRRKIDVAEVEAATKIRAKYLRALEHEDFELLPGPTFVKTFLRTYAEYLGLDAQLLIDEYRAQYEPREADAQPLIPASRRREARRRPRAPSGPPGPGTAVIVAVVVLLLIFVILGVTGGSGGGGSESAKTTPHVTARPKPRPRRAAPATVTLRVVPNGPTYVCVDHGRGTPAVIDTDISQPMTFRGRHLRINAGKPDVTLIANGQRVQVPPTGNPIGYDFRPTATTPIPPGPQRPCLG